MLSNTYTIIAAAVLGLVMGVPTLRLRADYLAIVTIAIAEILRVVANSARLQDLTGGPNGLAGVADDFYAINPIPEGRYGFGAWKFNQNTLFAMLVGWTLVVLASLLVWRLVNSPWGRMLKAIREDEDAARSLGKNAYWYKMQSLILGGMMGAVAGFAFAIAKTSVQALAMAASTSSTLPSRSTASIGNSLHLRRRRVWVPSLKPS